MSQKGEGTSCPYEIHIAMDFVFNLPHTQIGHDGIWTIIDRFSKQAPSTSVRKKIIAY